jgi:hypothetical protein
MHKHASATKAHRHMASAHHARGSTHTASASNSEDSQYRSALRRCVEGPQSQRDSCIDRAISQYGKA